MITGPQARELGRKIVFENPTGIGPTAIGLKILAMHPDMADANGKPNGTIRGGVWDLDKRFPGIIAKTDAGFVPIADRIIVPTPKAGDLSPDATAPDAAAPIAPSRKKNGSAKSATTRDQKEPRGDRAIPVSEEQWNSAQSKIAALEDAVSQAHAEIENRNAQIARLTSEISDAKQQIASPVGVLAEAQNASVLVDIRQAVLAGSDESTLEAVQRVVNDLATTRTKLALTGISDDAKRLKAARKAAGVTQLVLGPKLGYTNRSVIDLIERGMVALNKHPRVLDWVQKIEAKHANSVSGGRRS